MSVPKVSVLIPSYEYARYLPEAIESVLAQDFPDFELLISDDASTDGSGEVIAAYAAKDRRIRFHLHQANLGMVQNWNWCLSQARGEYIKFVCGDDKLASPRALARLVELLETNPSATLASSARLFIGENGEHLETWDFCKPGRHAGTSIICRCLEADRNLIGEPTAVLFRRREAARGFNPGYRQVVDMEFWFHLLEKGDFVYASEPLSCWRQHAAQQTRVNKRDLSAEAEALRLFNECLGKPYVSAYNLRLRLFNRLYDLRKHLRRTAHPSERLVKLERMYTATLTASWYAFYWSRRRLTRPFRNLRHWLAQPPKSRSG